MLHKTVNIRTTIVCTSQSRINLWSVDHLSVALQEVISTISAKLRSTLCLIMTAVNFGTRLTSVVPPKAI